MRGADASSGEYMREASGEVGHLIGYRVKVIRDDRDLKGQGYDERLYRGQTFTVNRSKKLDKYHVMV